MRSDEEDEEEEEEEEVKEEREIVMGQLERKGWQE